MVPRLVKYLIAIWEKPGFPLLGGGEIGGSCCLLLESGSPDELLLDSGGTDCLELEDCP